MPDLERILEAASIAAIEGGKKVFAHKNDPPVFTKGDGEPFTPGVHLHYKRQAANV